ncbi:MAG: guanylate kinase [Thiohalobacterales bacterium]|nr:guanylate kinase [Thiohalobacterales bacterium]
MSSEARSRGDLLIVAAPSGGGKTSLVNALLETDEMLTLSVSHTTRPPRSSEREGEHYYFVDQPEFERLVREDAFLEHAIVFGNHYGTHAGLLAEKLEQGLDVILEIDWQGARQVRERFPGCCSVFILPPSLDTLRERLSRRATDSSEVIARRMEEAKSEMSHWSEFDYLVVNDQFETALDDLQAVVRSLRLARARQQQAHHELLAELLGNG